MALKRIPIDQLTVGMYVTGCDRSWLQTPFLVHSFLVKTQDQIDKFKRAEIRHVDIDTLKGVACSEPSTTVPESSKQRCDTAAAAVAERCEAIQPPPPPARGFDGFSRAAEFAEARRERQRMLESMRNVLRSVQMSGCVQAAEVKQVSEKMIARTLDLDHALIALIRTREFDPQLYDHAVAVGTISTALGRILGYDDQWLQHLAEGALLHDIGLVGMPERLLKPGRPLSESEEREFDAHVQIGVDLLKKSVGIPREVVQLVREHHAASTTENPDDQSRPAQCCRVLKIVDVYDQLLSGQGGREPLPPREALQHLYKQAQQGRFDLKIVAHLITLVGIYPLYCLVELSSGHRGIVVKLNPTDLLKPVVLLIQGPDGARYGDPVLADLAAPTDNKAAMSIVRMLDAEKEGVRVEDLLQRAVTV